MGSLKNTIYTATRNCTIRFEYNTNVALSLLKFILLGIHTIHNFLIQKAEWFHGTIVYCL